MLASSRFLALPASQLSSRKDMDKEATETAEKCHIYLICRRPAPSFEPSDFSFSEGKISGRLKYKIEGKEHFYSFSFPFKPNSGVSSVSLSPYPHRSIRTLDQNGEVIGEVPAFSLSLMPAVSLPALQDLEVLYVGQAFAGGRRSAFDRLKSHSTLQEILAEMQHEMPDDEAIIITFEYPSYGILSSFDGTANDAIDDETDSKRFISIMDNPLTKEQQVCLTEAGLIRYFQPPFNEIYKHSFPKRDQKVLSSCYNLDFCGLVVEIGTSQSAFQLYSRSRTSAKHHIAKFDLFTQEERQSFFTLLNGEDAVTMPGVIAAGL